MVTLDSSGNVKAFWACHDATYLDSSAEWLTPSPRSWIKACSFELMLFQTSNTPSEVWLRILRPAIVLLDVTGFMPPSSPKRMRSTICSQNVIWCWGFTNSGMQYLKALLLISCCPYLCQWTCACISLKVSSTKAWNIEGFPWMPDLGLVEAHKN